MNKKLIVWLGVLALAAAPVACLRAQEAPGGDNEEVEVSENGPGQQPGADLPKKGGIDKDGEPGQRQVTVKVRKVMGRGHGGEPGMDMPRGMGPGMGGPGFLEEDEVMAVIKKNDAAFAKKLADLKTVVPAKYHMAMQMAGKMLAGVRMEEDEAMEKDAVRTLSLELDTNELSRKYDKASDADKPAIKEEIKTKSSELFDLKTKAQEIRMKRMASDLAKLQKQLQNRKANKAKIVDQRVDQLTGEGGNSW